MFAKGDLQLYR